MRRIFLALGMLAVMCILSACAPKETQRYQVMNNPASANQSETIPDISTDASYGSAPGNTENEAYNFDIGDYDPASEEGILDDLPNILDGSASLTTEPTPVPTMRSSYAGATPVVLDPIDKPTPTPVPPLTFANYATYDATNIGVSFSAPVGWTEETGNGSYTIVNPDTRIDYAARLTVSMASVKTDYTKSELTKEVKDILADLRKQYDSFSPTNTAERSLLDKSGVYADFTALIKDSQTKIGGRVHAVCVNKKLYVLTMTWPRDYTETYKDTVYKNFRHTIQVTK